ncbi:hypothetical protein CTI12_AA007790 [Artemisia annua]|nr:hypothetical protein CTI12_AA007790 [Artemisia annua]
MAETENKPLFKKTENKPNFTHFFTRLHGKSRKGIWKKLKNPGLRWKTTKFNVVHKWFVDRFLFKIASVVEAVVLVSQLCFFYLCCGCSL